jgi:hypothetical protein
MLRGMFKVVLLVALLATLVVSSVPSFGALGIAKKTKTCQCFCPFLKSCGGSCHFNETTGQCVNISCKLGCVGPF